MKIAILIITSLLSLQSIAGTETNWPQLLRDMKSIEKETIKLNNGAIVFEVAKLPNSGLRFLGFRNYSALNQAELTIDSSGKALGELCKDSQIFKKTFRAQLSIQKSPIEDNFEFSLANGQRRSTQEFQNPFKSENTTASLVEGSQFPWVVTYGDVVRYKKRPEEELLGMINNALATDSSERVVIDLSNHNALACDLAERNVQLIFERTLNFEKGLPEEKFWIDQYKFADLFRTFWEDKLDLNTKVSELEMKANELILLGWNLAEKQIPKNEVLKSSVRVVNLLNGLKYDKAGIDENDKPKVETTKLRDHWKKTAEFGIPSTLIRNDQIITSFGTLKVTFER